MLSWTRRKVIVKSPESESKVQLLIVSDLDISAKDVELGDKSIE